MRTYKSLRPTKDKSKLSHISMRMGGSWQKQNTLAGIVQYVYEP